MGARAVLVALTGLAGCTELRDEAPLTVPFDEVLSLEHETVLTEPDPPIGSVSRVAFAEDGAVYVLDGLLRRVLLFDASTGAALAAYGQAGQGPVEFGSVTGLAIEPGNGRVVVSDGGNQAMAILTPDLRLDTVVRLGRIALDVQATREGGPFVVDLYPGRSGPRLNLVGPGGELLETFHDLPPSFQSNPAT